MPLPSRPPSWAAAESEAHKSLLSYVGSNCRGNAVQISLFFYTLIAFQIVGCSLRLNLSIGPKNGLQLI